MKKVVIGLLITIIVITGVATIAFSSWLKKDPPEFVNIIENAVASEGLIALSHVDIDRVSTIQRLSLMKKTNNNLDSLTNSMNFSDVIQNSNDFNSSLEHLIIGIYNPVSSETSNSKSIDKPPVSFGFIGEFDWSKISLALQKKYKISTLGDNFYQLNALPPPADPLACPDDNNKDKAPYSTYYLLASRTNLIVSTERRYLLNLVERINQRANAEIDLSSWKKYKKGKIFSFAAYNPLTTSQVGSGITGMMARKATSDLDSLFLGATVDLLNRGIALDAKLVAPQEWITRTKGNIDSALLEFTESVQDISPSVSHLIDSIKTKNDGEALKLNFTFNNESLNNIQNTLSETVSNLFFSNIEFSSTSSEENVNQAEQIDDNPWNYQFNSAFENLPAYERDENFESQPQFIQGPYVINITSVKKDEKTNLIELEVQAKIQLPKNNTPGFDSGAELKLAIDSVTNKQKANVLRDERCIDRRDMGAFFTMNQRIAEGFNTSNDNAFIRKTIRLTESTELSNIATVDGTLNLTAPSRVQKISIKPVVGEKVENNNLKIFIKAIEARSVTLELKGDPDKLIDVRAINKEGKTLRTNGHSQMDKRFTYRFQGTVNELEFFIVEKSFEKNISFKLALDDFLKSETKTHKANINRQAHDFKTTQLSEWNKHNSLKLNDFDPAKAKNYYPDDSPLVGKYVKSPIFIQTRHDFKSSWQNRPEFEIFLPFIPSLSYNKSAVELIIDHKDNEPSKHSHFLEIIPNTYNDVLTSNFKLGELPLFRLKQQVELKLEPNTKLETLNGKLVIRIPSNIKKTSIKNLKFGIEDTASRLELNSISKGFSSGVSYKYSGNKETLINLILITQDGTRIMPNNMRTDNGITLIQFDYRADIKELELIEAANQHKIEYPFSIKTVYPEQ